MWHFKCTFFLTILSLSIYCLLSKCQRTSCECISDSHRSLESWKTSWHVLFCWFITGTIRGQEVQQPVLFPAINMTPFTNKHCWSIYWKWTNMPRLRRVTGKVCLLLPRIPAMSWVEAALQCWTHRWSGCWALCPEAPVMWAVLAESCSWVCCQWEKLDSGSFLALFRPASLHRRGGLGSSLRKDLQWDMGKQGVMLWDRLGGISQRETGEKTHQ